jgi:hypothetical protein
MRDSEPGIRVSGSAIRCHSTASPLPVKPQPASCAGRRSPNRGSPGDASSGRSRAANATKCRLKYPQKFVRKYLQKYPQPCARLRQHVYLHLNSDLCLGLNLDLDLNLYLFLFLNSFQQLFRKSFASFFDKLFVLKYW